MASEENEYIQDDWPLMPNGGSFDGTQLLVLLRDGKSPFWWDVNLLLQEIEENLGAQVSGIPLVARGSNNFGFTLQLSNGHEVVARLARGDVNMPKFDGFPLAVQKTEVRFEAETYKLLRSEPGIRAGQLLYHRAPVQYPDPRVEPPADILGRRLLVFEQPEGENDVWEELDEEQKTKLLAETAEVRASLFNFQLPPSFADTWLRERLFEQRPAQFPIPVAPKREFCIALFQSKIKATIREVGDMIGWESDGNTVGPVAFAAKRSLLRLIPHILPKDDGPDSLYRLVLEHGDFGVHNMTIAEGSDALPQVTSLFDWETGCIVPALLSDPLMAVTVDLVVDHNAAPSFTRVSEGASSESDLEQYGKWSRQYFKFLFDSAPAYKRAILAGADARHIWFALRDWRGAAPEEYFGSLGAWAQNRAQELGLE
ncbi:hypothetical protein GQ53DRAFT_883603 [Thozetella sp. PMI_491]|nr:hypothetical protein GQ53DRAFT_883603 [Thozetella sp. PMI_491]